MELESGGDQDVKLYRSVLTHVAHPGLNMSVDAQAQKYSVSTRQKSHVVLVCKSKPANSSRSGPAYLVSRWPASNQQGLAGEAARLYLFINLLGTGNERQGQYFTLSMPRARANVHTGEKRDPQIKENHL